MDRSSDTLILRIAAAACGLCALIYLAGARFLTVDEIEYFRATDWVAHGLVPYRDFFEHHLPLQWYLFAPFAALIRSPGASAIIAMRFLQLPLWLLTIGAMAVWLRRDGRSPLVAIAALLTSALFVMPAIEYRVDTVSVCAVMLAMVAGERRKLAAGALLAIAVLANVRFAPVAAIVFILLLVVADTWRRPKLRDVIAILTGAAIPIAIYAAYLFATHSAGAFWTNIVVNNGAIDRLARQHANRNFGVIAHALMDGLDAGTLLLIAGGIIVAVRADWRRPSRIHVAAIAALANLLFVLLMPVQYFYHFELTLLLCAFLVGHLEQRAVVAAITLAAALTVMFTLRISFAPLRVQDAVMHAANAAGDPVFDGSGFAIRRRPAYRYWFLPLGVRLLAREKLVEPYTSAALMADPPAAVVVDPRLTAWFSEWPDIRRAVIRHYVPRWRNVWLPGSSGVIGPGGTAAIEIVKTGDYRLIAAPELVAHPWFRNPIATTGGGGDLAIDIARIQTTGITTNAGDPSKPLRLQRGAQLAVTSRATKPIAFFLTPADAPLLFEAPENGEPLTDPLFVLR